MTVTPLPSFPIPYERSQWKEGMFCTACHSVKRTETLYRESNFSFLQLKKNPIDPELGERQNNDYRGLTTTQILEYLISSPTKKETSPSDCVKFTHMPQISQLLCSLFPFQTVLHRRGPL